MLNWTTLNLDKLLIGRVKGTAALGAYSLAYNVMFLPMTRIALPLGAVLLPAYSRLQDERERLELGWLRSKRIAVLLLMPCFATTFVVAPDLIPTVFGSKWDEAILPLQLLSIAGLAQAIGTFDHLAARFDRSGRDLAPADARHVRRELDLVRRRRPLGHRRRRGGLRGRALVARPPAALADDRGGRVRLPLRARRGRAARRLA